MIYISYFINRRITEKLTSGIYNEHQPSEKLLTILGDQIYVLHIQCIVFSIKIVNM